MNTVAPWQDADEAWSRVLGIQTKLHQWAIDDPNRRFDDLYNLVCDPAVLVEAWRRVKANRGARSAGVDGQTAAYISAVRGEEQFLADFRGDLKARTFVPCPAVRAGFASFGRRHSAVWLPLTSRPRPLIAPNTGAATIPVRRPGDAAPWIGRAVIT